MATEPLTGRGVPLAHAIVSTVNQHMVQAFVLAIWSANPNIPRPAYILTDMQEALYDGAALAIYMLRATDPDRNTKKSFVPGSFWCLFHVFRAWMNRLQKHIDLQHHMQCLAYLPTEESFDTRLRELRAMYPNVEVSAGKHKRKNWWDFFDFNYLRFKVSSFKCTRVSLPVPGLLCCA